MAVLRVELEVDGDVYPELHAALLSIAGEASRAERLRQLAASGLVWEKIRVHGPAVVHGGRAEALVAAAAQATAAAPPARKAAAAAPKQPRARAPEPPPPSSSPDFVDLALDAAPPQQQQPLRAPPVLMDVVEPEDLRSAALVPMRRHASLVDAQDIREARETRQPPELPAALAAVPPVVLPPPAVVAPQVMPPLEPAPIDELEAMVQAPPEPPIEHRPSTRSRLQRMKERGLFKNG